MNLRNTLTSKPRPSTAAYEDTNEEENNLQIRASGVSINSVMQQEQNLNNISVSRPSLVSLKSIADDDLPPVLFVGNNPNRAITKGTEF